MRNRLRILTLEAVVSLFAPFVFAPLGAEQLRCRAEVIPGDFVAVTAVNNRQEAVGVFFAGFGNHAFRFSAGELVDLGTLGGVHSVARDISDSGEVVGDSATAAGYLHAFSFRGGIMHDLGTLDESEPSAWSIAYGVNKRGLIVGQAATGSTARSFVYDHGAMTDLGTLGGSWSAAFGVNDSGKIVGFSAVTGNAAFHAASWENGKVADLGTLGGNYSRALHINNAGEIVGTSTTATGEWHAFLYRDGLMTDLGSLTGAAVTAEALNEKGWAVGHGEYGPAVNQHVPFLFADGEQIDLSSCLAGASLYFALDVTNSGVIAAVGETLSDHRLSSFLVRVDKGPSP